MAVTLSDSSGTVVAMGTTDADGRLAGLASGLGVGRYTLAWRVGGTLVDEVAVTLSLGEERHYHVPLLASPVAVVTYLGV